MKIKALEKRADVVTIYKILSNPLPLKNSEFQVLFGCCSKTATKKMREIQDSLAAKKMPYSADYITQEQFLEFMEWNFGKIERTALAIIAAQKGQALRINTAE